MLHKSITIAENRERAVELAKISCATQASLNIGRNLNYEDSAFDYTIISGEYRNDPKYGWLEIINVNAFISIPENQQEELLFTSAIGIKKEKPMQKIKIPQDPRLPIKVAVTIYIIGTNQVYEKVYIRRIPMLGQAWTWKGKNYITQQMHYFEECESQYGTELALYIADPNALQVVPSFPKAEA